MNNHSSQRLYDRVISNGVPLEEANTIVPKLERLASEVKKDVAVLCYKFRKEQVSDLSNGDEVWAIIRHNSIVTIMLRRNSQPKTCGALRVAQVIANL